MSANSTPNFDCCTSAYNLQLFLLLVSSTNLQVHVQEKQCNPSSSIKFQTNSTITMSNNVTSQLPLQSNHFLTTLAGIQMPKLIYGTAWKKDKTTELVVTAIRSGFRGIDTACAPKYYYEPGVGVALKILKNEDGIKRENLFIQTKFTKFDWQDPNNIPYDKSSDLTTQVQQSLVTSLKNLGTNYIDSLVLHGPLKTHEETMEVWKTFETFIDDGRVRQLGLSNVYSMEQFNQIFIDARHKPSVLQNKFYKDTGYDKELRKFCKQNGIIYQSFFTLNAHPYLLFTSIVGEISKKYNKIPEQILFAYLIGIGFAPLTGTKNKIHMKQNLEAMDLILTKEENNIIDQFFN